MERTELFQQGRSVPQEYLTPIDSGLLAGKGYTSINPMWRIQKLTEMFGPVGIGWWYNITKKWTEGDMQARSVMAFVDVDLYYRDPTTSVISQPIQGTGGAWFVGINKRGEAFMNNDCYKSALTDALSVAAKAIGIGADVYLDHDSDKYHDGSQEDQKAAAPSKKETQKSSAPAAEEKRSQPAASAAETAPVKTAEPAPAPVQASAPTLTPTPTPAPVSVAPATETAPAPAPAPVPVSEKSSPAPASTDDDEIIIPDVISLADYQRALNTICPIGGQKDGTRNKPLSEAMAIKPNLLNYLCGDGFNWKARGKELRELRRSALIVKKYQETAA